MSVEVVHGDGVVPVAQVVLGVGGLLLPLHAAHSQQDGCGESLSQREAEGTDKYLVSVGCRRHFVPSLYVHFLKTDSWILAGFELTV